MTMTALALFAIFAASVVMAAIGQSTSPWDEPLTRRPPPWKS